MEEKLYLLVLKFLTFRPRSEKEVRDYLKRKLKSHPGKFERTHPGSTEDSGQVRMTENNGLIDLIIHKLKQQNFLNDYDFSKWLIRSHTEFKPKGERLIRLELSQKGISKDIMDEAFSSIEHRSKTEKELAIDLLERRKKKYAAMDRQERFNKAGSYLARRGFDLDDIKVAIDQVFGKMV